jgi:hypothetical protein
MACTRRFPSRPLYEAIDHLLRPGLFEGDGELVAVHLHHMAVAEFLVKHPVAFTLTPPRGQAREIRSAPPYRS